MLICFNRIDKSMKALLKNLVLKYYEVLYFVKMLHMSLCTSQVEVKNIYVHLLLENGYYIQAILMIV